MKNKEEIKISRSKIELFMECPRCFWLEEKHNIKRPEKFTSAHIGNKYDSILKKYFDYHRENNLTPKDLEDLDFKLYPDIEKLKIWRNKGIKYFHPEHKIIYYGKIDDLLISKEGCLVPFDFKTTLSKEFKIDGYRQQLEIYGYLLKKNGEAVLNQGVLYFINALL